ncbi:TetR/AcrR family transcriptional regulator [Actinophytocola gossypii]|uniref:TetR/AcrR family transcriptional regulator n=1 Tax=Actinophytocola gossypii TaxID=2812003 RepID=UPI0021A5B7BD|nr:TetR/AcrR family transcriptional regulator [Actinophytocola gossypii]
MLSRPMTPAGERLLATASDLFYRRGIRAVGVDLIAEQAGTTKKTLYDRFGSKDNLVALYLRARFERWQAFVDERLALVEPGQGQVLAAFDVLAEWLADNTRGCAFVNANAEIDRTDHPAMAVVHAEKRWMRARYERLVHDAGLPSTLGAHLHLLHEGAIVATTAGAQDDAVANARSAARTLLAAALSATGPGGSLVGR